jgi:hypothetical protein
MIFIRPSRVAILLGSAAVSVATLAQPSGLTQRVPNTTLQMPANPAAFGYNATSNALPGLTFNGVSGEGSPFERVSDPSVAYDAAHHVWLISSIPLLPGPSLTVPTVFVSRSTDGGTTFPAPAVVFQPTNSADFPDKPWMAVNTFPGTTTEGRILVTWTQFGTTNFSPILRAYSDDHGLTWSTSVPIHSANTSAQGSQPMFLRDGRVAIVYWNFAESGFGGDNATVTPEEIEKKLKRVNSPMIVSQGWSGTTPGGTFNYSLGIFNPDPTQASNLFAHVWVGSGNIDPTVGTFLLNVDTRFPRLTEPPVFGLTLAPGASATLNSRPATTGIPSVRK